MEKRTTFRMQVVQTTLRRSFRKTSARLASYRVIEIHFIFHVYSCFSTQVELFLMNLTIELKKSTTTYRKWPNSDRSSACEKDFASSSESQAFSHPTDLCPSSVILVLVYSDSLCIELSKIVRCSYGRQPSNPSAWTSMDVTIA